MGNPNHWAKTEDEPMTDEELDGIEARIAATTPGPWKFYHPSEHEHDFRVAFLGNLPPRDANGNMPIWNGGYVFRLTQAKALERGQEGALHPREEDARFITYARRDVPRLLAEVRRLRALLAARGES